MILLRVVGLTGSIACGKSTVSRYLASLHYPVVDGDLLAREVTAPGSPALSEIRRAFGERYLSESGSLNRRAMAQLIFHDDDARNRLDLLLAPYLEALTLKRIEDCRAGGAALCFLDMPLLFERGYDRFCDSVWTVWLPVDIQCRRLMERDHLDEQDAIIRIRSVLSSDEKASRSDHVIDNSGPVSSTLSSVDRLLELELNEIHPVHVPSEPPTQNRTFPSREPVVTPIPDTMTRPAAATRSSQRRKASWMMPPWLKTSLISLTAVLMVLITAQALMSGWLYRQEEKHRTEQAAIDAKYPLQYAELISRYAGEYNLRPAFVAAVIRNESSFRPDAESSVGARGLMQLMPATAEWIAEKLSISAFSFDRMYDPESNIRFGCWYLRYLSNLFGGNPVCVISAYHAGQGQVAAWLSSPSVSIDGRTIDLNRLPDGPTKIYAGRVTRDYGIYQEKYYQTLSPAPDGSGAADS